MNGFGGGFALLPVGGSQVDPDGWRFLHHFGAFASLEVVCLVEVSWFWRFAVRVNRKLWPFLIFVGCMDLPEGLDASTSLPESGPRKSKMVRIKRALEIPCCFLEGRDSCWGWIASRGVEIRKVETEGTRIECRICEKTHVY